RQWRVRLVAVRCEEELRLAPVLSALHGERRGTWLGFQVDAIVRLVHPAAPDRVAQDGGREDLAFRETGESQMDVARRGPVLPDPAARHRVLDQGRECG